MLQESDNNLNSLTVVEFTRRHKEMYGRDIFQFKYCVRRVKSDANAQILQMVGNKKKKKIFRNKCLYYYPEDEYIHWEQKEHVETAHQQDYTPVYMLEKAAMWKSCLLFINMFLG